MIDIEIVETAKEQLIENHKKSEIVNKRLVLSNIELTDKDFKQLTNNLMRLDRNTFYENKDILKRILESAIDQAFNDGKRLGTIRTQYIRGERDGRTAEEVYPTNGFTIAD